jgi:hypothetical protein
MDDPMRPILLAIFILTTGCGKATLNDDDAGGDGDGDDGGAGADAATGCGAGCGADQVCLDDICEDLDDVAMPAYATRWRDVTGWTDENASAINATFAAVDIPGIRFECRTGHASVFAALPFAACDGGDGSGASHVPAPTADNEEGGYRTEVRLALGDWTSAAIGFDFYAHRSLDGVRTCAPAHTDAQIFAAADPLLNNTVAFGSATAVQAPFVRLPFTNIIKVAGMHDGTWAGVANGGNFIVDVLSLRRRFVLNADRTMLLIQRTYESRGVRDMTNTHSCRNSFKFGHTHGTPSSNYEDCVNFVLNSRGQGVCVVPGETGARFTTQIGWVKLLRDEAFSNKGLTEACVPSPLSHCWSGYLYMPD